MGLFDNIKDSAEDLAKEHADKIDDGIEAAGDFVDEKTDGKYADQVDQAQEFLKEQADKLTD